MKTSVNDNPIIEVRDLKTFLGGRWIHSGLDFKVPTGAVNAIIGSSGCGKSVLLREIVGLLSPHSGIITVLGHDVWQLNHEQRRDLCRSFGFLFQDGALFSGLTVEENVAVPLLEAGVSRTHAASLARLKLTLSGLDKSAYRKYPSELSGGMKKRAALARALALDPEILFLDEPTSGLDPITARAFDALIRELTQGMGVTTLMVTHDVDSLFNIVDHLIVLDGGKVLTTGTVSEVSKHSDSWIREYFSSSRATNK